MRVCYILLFTFGILNTGGSFHHNDTCPGQCTCAELSTYFVDCKRAGINGTMTDIIPGDTAHLDLSKNHITDIGTTLNNLSKLEFLALDHNKLEQIKEDAFVGANNIITLQLEGNLLSCNAFLSDPFRNFERNFSLSVKDNKLGPILEPLFWHALGQVYSLDLSGNGLKHIDIGQETLDRLTYFTISDNDFMDIPAMVNELGNLREFCIAGNPIEKLSRYDFSGLANIERIEIRGMPNLVEIKSEVFYNLPSLKNLVITDNQRLSIINKNFIANSTITVLQLQDNRLMYLSPDAIPWHLIVVLLLFDNPWDCDCKLNSFVKAYQNRFGVHAESHKVPECFIPEDIAGETFLALSTDQMICPATTTTIKPDKVSPVNAGNVVGLMVLTSALTMVMFLAGLKVIQIIRKKRQGSPTAMEYETLDTELQAK